MHAPALQFVFHSDVTGRDDAASGMAAGEIVATFIQANNLIDTGAGRPSLQDEAEAAAIPWSKSVEYDRRRRSSSPRVSRSPTSTLRPSTPQLRPQSRSSLRLVSSQ